MSAFPLHEEAGRGVGAVTPSSELLQGISSGGPTYSRPERGGRVTVPTSEVKGAGRKVTCSGPRIMAHGAAGCAQTPQSCSP